MQKNSLNNPRGFRANFESFPYRDIYQFSGRPSERLNSRGRLPMMDRGYFVNNRKYLVSRGGVERYRIAEPFKGEYGPKEKAPPLEEKIPDSGAVSTLNLPTVNMSYANKNE